MANQNLNQSSNKSKKTIFIGIAITVGVIVIFLIEAMIYYGTREEKTPTEQQQKKLEKIVNKVEVQAEDSKVVIARIESTIKENLTGNNNQGNPYFQWMLVDRRYTEEEEYFATIRFNADIYPIVTDYKQDKKKEKEAIEKKMAELLKALYGSKERLTIAQIEAYDSTSTLSAQPVYSIELIKEKADTIDWNQDLSALQQTLSKTWIIKDTNYQFID